MDIVGIKEAVRTSITNSTQESFTHGYITKIFSEGFGVKFMIEPQVAKKTDGVPDYLITQLSIKPGDSNELIGLLE